MPRLQLNHLGIIKRKEILAQKLLEYVNELYTSRNNDIKEAAAISSFLTSSLSLLLEKIISAIVQTQIIQEIYNENKENEDFNEYLGKVSDSIFHK